MTTPCVKRAVSGMAVSARMGMEGRYLAMSRAVVPDSVSTTIILASTSKAVFTAVVVVGVRLGMVR